MFATVPVVTLFPNAADEKYVVDEELKVNLGRLGRGWGGSKKSYFSPQNRAFKGILSHFEGGPSLSKSTIIDFRPLFFTTAPYQFAFRNIEGRKVSGKVGVKNLPP